MHQSSDWQSISVIVMACRAIPMIAGIYVCVTYVHIACIVKKVASFRGLSQLVVVECNRTHAQAVQKKLLVAYI